MFVSVVRQDGNTVSIYECDQVHINNREDEVSFHLQRDSLNELAKDFFLDVSKRDGTAVYLMNNTGKTIDTYKWAWIDEAKESAPKGD